MTNRNKEDDEPAIAWPIVVAVGKDDPARFERQLDAGRLPPDAKRVLWRHLVRVYPELAKAIHCTPITFPGCTIRVTLTGRSKRIHDILKLREGKADEDKDGHNRVERAA